MSLQTNKLIKEKLFYQEKNVIELGVEHEGEPLLAISANLITKSLRPHVLTWRTRNQRRYGIVTNSDYMNKSISLDYSFPTTLPGFEPKLHQKITAEFIINNKKCIVLNGTGSGKTLASVWAADYLIKKGDVKRVLIIGPLTGVMDAWQRELNTHFCKYKYSMLAGPTTDARRRKILNPENKDTFIVMNHDGVTTAVRKGAIPEGFFDMVIYDESTAIKNVDSDRYGFFFRWVYKNSTSKKFRLVLMTGTPIAQSQVDAFSPSKLVDSPAMKEMGINTINTWKSLVLKKVFKFKYEEQKDTIPLCYKIMQPSICFSKKDCIDLPDFTYIDVNIEETKQQKAIIAQLKQDRLAFTDSNGIISASNAAVLKMRFLQCWSGVTTNEDGSFVKIDNQPRLDALEEILTASDHPVVVFTAYKGSQAMLVDYFTKKKMRVGCINGDVTGNKRKEIIDAFQNYELDVLFAHPKTTAHSIDLTRSATIVFYTPIYSNELYLQGLDRIQRLSSAKYGHEKFTIYHFIASEIEAEIFARLKDKTLTQEGLLEMFRDAIGLD